MGVDNWFKKMRKSEEAVGIFDLLEVYGDYRKAVDLAFQYLFDYDVEIAFATSDSTSD